MNRLDFAARARALAQRPDLDAAPPAAPPSPEARMSREGVPQRYLGCSLANWQARQPGMSEARLAVTAFMADPVDHWLALIGRHGTGKTHLACACLRERGGRYTTARGLVQRILSASCRWDERDRFANAGLLVIDEIPSGAMRDVEYDVLYDVLDARYAERRPCVLVANATAAQFRGVLRPALADRFAEVGIAVGCEWESWRAGAT